MTLEEQVLWQEIGAMRYKIYMLEGRLAELETEVDEPSSFWRDILTLVIGVAVVLLWLDRARTAGEVDEPRGKRRRLEPLK
jgi:hypothetical protein